MSKTIQKTGTLAPGSNPATIEEPVTGERAVEKKGSFISKNQAAKGIQSLIKNIDFSNSKKDVARFLSLGDHELANIALHTAYVEKVRKALEKEAAAAVPGFKTAAQHKYLRELIADYAALKAEVQYAREELNGVPLSHSRAKAVDPVAFMGELDRGKNNQPPKRYDVNLETGFIGSSWHPAEGSDNQYWRWSGPQSSSTILLPSLGGGKLRFALNLNPINKDPAFIEGLRIYVNGVEADLGILNEETFSNLSFIMDVGHAEPYEKLVLRIEVPRAYTPNELEGSQDYRKLGVAMFGCSVSIEETSEN